MYCPQFADRRMPDHRVYQRLHRQLREIPSFHVIRHDTGRRRAVRSPSLEESILNVVPDSAESNARAVAHHVSVNHQTVCRVINENHLHLSANTSFESVTLSFFRLPVCGTAMCAAAGLHSSCAEQLRTVIVSITLLNDAFSLCLFFCVYSSPVICAHTFLCNK
ncbi:hypothetical protein TNCV_4494051 [Trichonephila clavipes]|nr:hypothetical protein TNCV_4494051 [Trichonephila clavipes]